MSAKLGHSAYDAEADIRDQLADLKDDEARAKFLRAAVVHTRQQAETLAKQADEVQNRADDVSDAWQAKAREAAGIYDLANAEAERWAAALAEFEGR